MFSTLADIAVKSWTAAEAHVLSDLRSRPRVNTDLTQHQSAINKLHEVQLVVSLAGHEAPV